MVITFVILLSMTYLVYLALYGSIFVGASALALQFGFNQTDCVRTICAQKLFPDSILIHQSIYGVGFNPDSGGFDWIVCGCGHC